MAKKPTKVIALTKQAAALKAQLEAMPGAIGAPGPTGGVTIVKVMGKMFAILSAREDFVILKCDPHLAEQLRTQYEGVGHRSHLDKRFWIAVSLNGDVPMKEVKRLAAHSYDLVRATLTRKQRAELEALAS